MMSSGHCLSISSRLVSFTVMLSTLLALGLHHTGLHLSFLVWFSLVWLGSSAHDYNDYYSQKVKLTGQGWVAEAKGWVSPTRMDWEWVESFLKENRGVVLPQEEWLLDRPMKNRGPLSTVPSSWQVDHLSDLSLRCTSSENTVLAPELNHSL